MKEKNYLKWEEVYAERPAEEMPWYYPTLDPDLEKALKDLNINSGSFLDLGTGPGTQAAELAKRGFDVTGTDISKTAINKASRLWDHIRFIQDDILQSKLKQQFDYVFDRGCFHVMSEDERPMYLKTVTQLLKPKGLLFLKCFSDREPETGSGPHRISKKMIEQIFSEYFEIRNIFDTEILGALPHAPKALFVIMRKK